MQRKCYSYIRFSTKKQGLGTSLDRQSDIEAFLQRHNLVLDTRLEDLGVSAFRGKNAQKGQLGGFMNHVREGLIEPNSVLLIENFDRLSRQKIIKSTQIFIELMTQGIDLGILDLGRIYTRESLVSSDFFNVILEFERANKESERKSDFTSSAWNFHRAEMQALKIPKTRKTPSWIKVEGTIKGKKSKDGDARFVIVEREAEKVRKIFDLALVYGLSETAKKINEWLDDDEKKYAPHQIQYLLKNRKVIGEHQPMKFHESESGEMKLMPEGEPIEGYYPQIVSKEIFEEVQEKIVGRKPFAGRFSQTRQNVLSGLLKCYHCGGTVRYMDKSSDERKDKHYFVCTNSMSGKCTLPHRLSYDASEAMQYFFEKTEKLNLLEIFDSDETVIKITRNIKEVESKLSSVEKQIGQLQRQIRDSIEKGKDIPDFLNELLIEKESERKTLANSCDALIKSKNEHIERSEISKRFSQENVLALLRDKSEEGIRKRININNHLLKIIKEIKVFWRKKGKRGLGTPLMVVEFQNGVVRVILDGDLTIDSDNAKTEVFLKQFEETHRLYIEQITH